MWLRWLRGVIDEVLKDAVLRKQIDPKSGTSSLKFLCSSQEGDGVRKPACQARSRARRGTCCTNCYPSLVFLFPFVGSSAAGREVQRFVAPVRFEDSLETAEGYVQASALVRPSCIVFLCISLKVSWVAILKSAQHDCLKQVDRMEGRGIK
jgi:hypothetical protein